MRKIIIILSALAALALLAACGKKTPTGNADSTAVVLGVLQCKINGVLHRFPYATAGNFYGIRTVEGYSDSDSTEFLRVAWQGADTGLFTDNMNGIPELNYHDTLDSVYYQSANFRCSVNVHAAKFGAVGDTVRGTFLGNIARFNAVTELAVTEGEFAVIRAADQKN
jgi:hypothetical protein